MGVDRGGDEHHEEEVIAELTVPVLDERIAEFSRCFGASWLWGRLNARGEGVLSLLMDVSGTRFTGRVIASAVAIPNGASGVAGVLARPARFCIGIGRHLPTSWQGGEDGAESTYLMEPEVAELFTVVRGESGTGPRGAVRLR